MKILAIAFVAALGLTTGQAETVRLDELDLAHVRQSWGQPHANQSVTGQPLAIAGQSYEHGVGTHAASVLYIDLAGGTQRFTARVGVDDDNEEPRGTVVFRIVGDSRLLWKSPVLKSRAPAANVDLKLDGIKTLILIVNDAGDGIDFDHADWADAQFEFTGTRPKSIPTPREEPVILTPKPPAEPRINGPQVYGVRPGAPVLFAIPATGARPMRFSVDGLPDGLRVDATTGQITGTTKDAGRHILTLHAENDRGRAARELALVVGDTLALTPPMGWNSWYVLENRVTDADIRAAADAMVSSGLSQHGFTYVDIDDCWAIKPDSNDPALQGEPRDATGRINTNQRFPDMQALTEYIHARGLKAGIYTSPGPTTCAGHVGSFGHEEQDARTFAAWGFDFLKYDWCSYDTKAADHSLPELKKPYQLMGDILKKLDRDVVFNLCQYGMGNVAEWGREVGGNCWRTTADLGASFEAVPQAMFQIGFGQNGLEPWAGPGHWNDPDYLLLGYISNWNGGTAPTPLTPNEQYTQVSLWCLLAAPLFLSGDITRLDDFTLGLLTDDEVLAVDQDALGRQGRRVAQEDELEVWMKDLEDGGKAVGLFNRGEYPATVTARWADLGLTGSQRLRDLWRQKDLGPFQDSFSAEVARHGVVLVRFSAPAGARPATGVAGSVKSTDKQAKETSK